MKFISALLVSGLVLTACGGESADTTTEGTVGAEATATTAAAADTDAAVTAYTECMRDNGADIEDPTVDENGRLVPGALPGLPEPGQGDGQGTPGGDDQGTTGGDDQGTPGGPGALDEDLQAALEVCNQLLDGTGLGFGGGPQGQDPEQLQEQFAALSECLSEQGIEVAEPDTTAEPGQGGGPFGGFGGIDLQDPEVQAAMEQCGDLLPDFGGGGPGGAGGGQAPPQGDG